MSFRCFNVIAGFVLIATSVVRVEARVNTCILDGGGSIDQRYCGLNRIHSRMGDMYEQFSQTRGQGADLSNGQYVTERIFTGDGEGRGADCHVPGKFSCTSRSGDCSSPSGTPAVNFNTVVRPFNAQSSVHPASRDDINRQCFSGASASDVCHFYSYNHGTLSQVGDIPNGGNYQAMRPGLSLYSATQTSDPPRFESQELRQLMSNSSCGTHRFILNSCYGGGMMKAMFGSDGKLIPNRCGSASAAWFQPSNGSASDPQSVTLAGGRQVRVRTNVYDFSEEMFSGLGNGALKLRTQPDHYGPYDASLDSAFAKSLMTDTRNETPQMTSDFYFDKHFDSRHDRPIGLRELREQERFQEEIKNQTRCYGDYLGDNFSVIDKLGREIEQITDVLGEGMNTKQLEIQADGLTPTELGDINRDLALQQSNLDQFSEFMCRKFFAQPRPELGMSDACPTTPGARRGYIMSFYKKFRAKRLALMNDYQKCIKRNGNSAGCRDEEQKYLHFLGDNQYTRRFEMLLNRVGRSMEFYQTANAEKVREYLGLRRCETAAYDSPPGARIEIPRTLGRRP